MNKHTKGPWAIATKRNESNNTISIGIPYLSNGSLETVSAIAYAAPQPHYKDNQEANARLIAAAPELLEALQNAHIRACKARLYGVDMLSSKNLCLDDVISIITEAIKKAKGE